MNYLISWFLNFAIFQQLLVLYFILINAISFFYFGMDKMKSQLANARRVSEKRLWTLCFLGGSLGGLAGMYFFRHKTKKISFQAMFLFIFMLQIFLVFLILNNF